MSEGSDAHESGRSPKRIKLDSSIAPSEALTPDDDNRKVKRPFRPYKHSHTLAGHERAISKIQYSPDGTRIATASADASVKIWVAATGELEQTLLGHAKGLSDVSWSSTSEYLVSASDDRTLRVWTASSGRSVRTFRGHTNFVLCGEFNPAGTLVASGSFDESIKIWDVRAGKCLRTLPAHSDPVSSVKFNVDGTMLVSCSHDSLIRIWDTASGQCLKTLIDQDSPPMSFAAFSPNGRFILSCTLDSTVRIWNFVNSVPLKTYKGHLNVKFCINAEMNNDEVIVGGEDGRITVWHTQTKDVLQIVDTGCQSPLLSVSKYIAADGTCYLATAGLDKVARIYCDGVSTSEAQSGMEGDIVLD